MIKGIIFDFDGVIAESIQMKTDAFATLYSDNGADIVQRVVSHHEANGGMSRFDKIKYYNILMVTKSKVFKVFISPISGYFLS